MMWASFRTSPFFSVYGVVSPMLLNFFQKKKIDIIL